MKAEDLRDISKESVGSDFLESIHKEFISPLLVKEARMGESSLTIHEGNNKSFVKIDGGQDNIWELCKTVKMMRFLENMGFNVRTYSNCLIISWN
jgi:hypothetical protein